MYVLFSIPFKHQYIFNVTKAMTFKMKRLLFRVHLNNDKRFCLSVTLNFSEKINYQDGGHTFILCYCSLHHFNEASGGLFFQK